MTGGDSTEADLPELEGKVICITGGTAGLGSASVLALAKRSPAHIYFTGRNAKAAQTIITTAKTTSPNVGLTFLELDLTSLDSIQAGLQGFTHQRLDILICNAGIMSHPLGVSQDGYEIHFAVNHLGNALVIQTLLPTMTKTASQPNADVRIVLLTSVGWRAHPAEGVQFSTIRSTQELGWTWGWRRYGQSKLANIVYAAKLARRFPEISSVSVHPGVVSTGLVGDLSALRRALIYVANLGNVVGADEGVKNQLWAAAGARKGELQNGAFYMPVGVLSQNKLDKMATSEELARELWEWTDEALKGKY